MSNRIEDLNVITEKITGWAIEVHGNSGPGLLESIYEKALCFESDRNNVRYEKQLKIPIVYKGLSPGEYRVGLPVENEIIVEIKTVERNDPDFNLSESHW